MLEGGQRQAPDGDQPLLVALAQYPDQRDVAALDRFGHVPQVEADDLADAAAGAVEHLEQGPVAQHGRPGADHRTEQPCGLVFAEGLGEHLGHTDPGDVGGRIGGRCSLLDQKAMEAPQRGEGPGHRRSTADAPQGRDVGRHLVGRRRVDRCARAARFSTNDW